MSQTAEIARREQLVFAPIEEAARLPAGSITLVGLDLTDPDMPFTDWQDLGRRLGHVHRWSVWALGDWLLFGEAVYGEDAYAATEGATVDRYDLAHRITGLAVGTLQNYASVCARIARGRRRVELFFSTHEPVAALEPDEQTAWLQRAIDEGWTKTELRDAIREAKNPAALDDPEPNRNGDGGGYVSIGERVESAARMVVEQAQSTSSGEWLVPPEPMVQLRSALGEGA